MCQQKDESTTLPVWTNPATDGSEAALHVTASFAVYHTCESPSCWQAAAVSLMVEPGVLKTQDKLHASV